MFKNRKKITRTLVLLLLCFLQPVSVQAQYSCMFENHNINMFSRYAKKTLSSEQVKNLKKLVVPGDPRGYKTRVVAGYIDETWVTIVFVGEGGDNLFRLMDVDHVGVDILANFDRVGIGRKTRPAYLKDVSDQNTLAGHFLSSYPYNLLAHVFDIDENIAVPVSSKGKRTQTDSSNNVNTSHVCLPFEEYERINREVKQFHHDKNSYGSTLDLIKLLYMGTKIVGSIPLEGLEEGFEVDINSLIFTIAIPVILYSRYKLGFGYFWGNHPVYGNRLYRMRSNILDDLIREIKSGASNSNTLLVITDKAHTSPLYLMIQERTRLRGITYEVSDW